MGQVLGILLPLVFVIVALVVDLGVFRDDLVPFARALLYLGAAAATAGVWSVLLVGWWTLPVGLIVGALLWWWALSMDRK